jgi:hypothetical protein
MRQRFIVPDKHVAVLRVKSFEFLQGHFGFGIAGAQYQKVNIIAMLLYAALDGGRQYISPFFYNQAAYEYDQRFICRKVETGAQILYFFACLY